MVILRHIGITDCLNVVLGDGLLIRGKLAGEQQIIRVKKLAMMAHVESGHLLLDLLNAGETSSLLHHLNHALILQLSSDVQSILQQLAKTNILNSEIFYIVADV